MGRRILLAILTLFGAATRRDAQAGGRIVGRVSAADGRALPGIQVTVTGTTRGARVGQRRPLSRSATCRPDAASSRRARIGFATATDTGRTSPPDRRRRPTSHSPRRPRCSTRSSWSATANRIAARSPAPSAPCRPSSSKDIPTTDPMKALQGKSRRRRHRGVEQRARRGDERAHPRRPLAHARATIRSTSSTAFRSPAAFRTSIRR